MITKKDEIINRGLFKNYFHQFESLPGMQEKLRKTGNAQKNEELVQTIKNGIIDLNNETKKMSRDENEKANEIIDAVAEICLTLIIKIKKDMD